MSTSTATPTAKEASVGMGQVAILESQDSAKAVLGSCIGVVLYHKLSKQAAVAHVVLPNSSGRKGAQGKFADQAIPYMIDELAKKNARRCGLSAKLAGGANMFGSDGPIQIGQENLQAIKQLLAELHIPIVCEHVGGGKGRRIEFDCTSGDLKVFIAGEGVIVL